MPWVQLPARQMESAWPLKQESGMGKSCCSIVACIPAAAAAGLSGSRTRLHGAGGCPSSGDALGTRWAGSAPWGS